jgi:hypothetical protein
MYFFRFWYMEVNWRHCSTNKNQSAQTPMGSYQPRRLSSNLKCVTQCRLHAAYAGLRNKNATDVHAGQQFQLPDMVPKSGHRHHIARPSCRTCQIGPDQTLGRMCIVAVRHYMQHAIQPSRRPLAVPNIANSAHAAILRCLLCPPAGFSVLVSA